MTYFFRWCLHWFGVHWWREWEVTFGPPGTHKRCRICGEFRDSRDNRWLV